MAKIKNYVTRGLFVASLATMMIGSASASSITVDDSGLGTTADSLMGKIIGILLSITRYVGVALLIYGVYEVFMSFMQNQPEAKTKGIIMALCGVCMISLKSILVAVGVVA